MQTAEETFEQIQYIFSALDGPRDPRGIRHDLVEVITIAILAAVCGCADAEAYVLAASVLTTTTVSRVAQDSSTRGRPLVRKERDLAIESTRGRGPKFDPA